VFCCFPTRKKHIAQEALGCPISLPSSEEGKEDINLLPNPEGKNQAWGDIETDFSMGGGKGKKGGGGIRGSYFVETKKG